MAEQSSTEDRAPSVGDRAMRVAENVVYATVAVLLVASALLAIGAIGYRLATDLDDGVSNAVTKALDGLLLVWKEREPEE